MYSNGNENDERMMRERMRQIRHDIRNAERARVHALKDEIKLAEHAKIDALKQAIKYGMQFSREGFGNENCMGNTPNSAPQTLDQMLEEIDSYISYLEDLPKEKVSPYQEKLGRIEEHLKKLRGTL